MTDVQIEQVNESDPSEGDISDLSDDDFDDRDIIRAKIPQASRESARNPVNLPSTTRFQTTQNLSQHANFQCIYPIYFDKLRSRRQGRMVGKELAVENPMAREIVNACGRLGLETLFEPTKYHPRDWANPGRVKVKLREGRNQNIKNKHHLYILISKHLLENTTTIESAKTMLIPGAPAPDQSKDYPTPAIPRGWKMGTILPYYSPALSDCGSNEEMFKQMMAQMQSAGGTSGGMPGGAPNMAAFQEILGRTTPSSSTTATEKKKKKPKKKN